MARVAIETHIYVHFFTNFRGIYQATAFIARLQGVWCRGKSCAAFPGILLLVYPRSARIMEFNLTYPCLALVNHLFYTLLCCGVVRDFQFCIECFNLIFQYIDIHIYRLRAAHTLSRINSNDIHHTSAETLTITGISAPCTSTPVLDAAITVLAASTTATSALAVTAAIFVFFCMFLHLLLCCPIWAMTADDVTRAAVYGLTSQSSTR